ncbi:MAG: endonuclease/exonuclease/phosphatase family protein [Planctomycetota bacterium]
MTYNVLYDGDWDAVRALILSNPVDILCLQEVAEEAFPSRRVIRQSMVREAVPWASEYAPLWHRSPRRIGNMTLVLGSIKKGHILSTPVSQPYGLVNEVEVGGARLTVANIHMTEMLGPPPVAFPVSEVLRLREAIDLTRRFSRCRNPVIALGDFNTFWPAPACWVLRRAWRDCRTVAGGRHAATRRTYGLPFVIDHIFVRGGANVLDYRVIEGGGSDHRAVVARLEVPILRP